MPLEKKRKVTTGQVIELAAVVYKLTPKAIRGRNQAPLVVAARGAVCLITKGALGKSWATIGKALGRSAHEAEACAKRGLEFDKGRDWAMRTELWDRVEALRGAAETKCA